MGVPTVLIAQQDSADDIPFDLRQYRTEFYDTHFQRARHIVDALADLGRKYAAREVSFGSPISDFLPGAAKPAPRAERQPERHEPRGSTVPDEQAAAQAVETTQAQSEEELGLWDFMDAVTEASEQFIEAITPINAATEDIGVTTQEFSDQMNALDPSNPGTQARARRIVLKSAMSLDRYAETLESHQPEIENSVDSLTSNGLGYLTLVAENPAQNREELEASQQVLSSLRDTTVEAMGSVSQFRDTIAGMPPVIKQLNRARTRTVRALDAILAQQDRVRSYAEQALGLVEGALTPPDAGAP
jgi:hypothetical protein